MNSHTSITYCKYFNDDKNKWNSEVHKKTHEKESADENEDNEESSNFFLKKIIDTNAPLVADRQGGDQAKLSNSAAALM